MPQLVSSLGVMTNSDRHCTAAVLKHPDPVTGRIEPVVWVLSSTKPPTAIIAFCWNMQHATWSKNWARISQHFEYFLQLVGDSSSVELTSQVLKLSICQKSKYLIIIKSDEGQTNHSVFLWSEIDTTTTMYNPATNLTLITYSAFTNVFMCIQYEWMNE